MDRIKVRQICFYFIAMMPVAKLLVYPATLTYNSGNDLIASALINCITEGAIVALVMLLAKKTGKSLFQLTEGAFGKIAAKIIYALFALFFFASSLLPMLEQKNFVLQVMYENSKKNLANTLNAIKVGLGIVDSSIDIEVSGLVFSYITLSDTDIESKLQDSLYLEIVALDIADYANSAKFASRSRFDSVEIGAGANIAESNTGAAFKVKIPLPLTTKYGNQKAMYLALQSGSVRESEILKNTLQSNAHSYLKQLEMKKNAISVAQADEENKKKAGEHS